MAKSIFMDDVIERSVIARSARHKKPKGGRSVHTKMPSDNMTNAQKAKLNGPVEIYNFDQPMTWTDFKMLEDRLKREYLNNLIRKYGASGRSIAAMFSISESTLYRWAKTLGVRLPYPHSIKDSQMIWKSFLERANQMQNTAESNQENKPASPVTCEALSQTPLAEEDASMQNNNFKHPDAPVASAASDDRVILASGSITLQGSATACLEKIASLLGTTNCTLTVQWELANPTNENLSNITQSL